MYCTKCGNAIADDARFCNKCGAPVSGGNAAQNSAQGQAYGGSAEYGAQGQAYGGSAEYGAQGQAYGGSAQYGAQGQAYGSSAEYGAQGQAYGGSAEYGAQGQAYGGSAQYGAQGQSYGGSAEYGTQGQAYGSAPQYGAGAGAQYNAPQNPSNGYGGSRQYGKGIFTIDTAEMLNYGPDGVWLKRAGIIFAVCAVFEFIQFIMRIVLGLSPIAIIFFEFLAIGFTAFVCLSNMMYKGVLISVSLGVYFICYFIYRSMEYGSGLWLSIIFLLCTFGVSILCALRIFRIRIIALAIQAVATLVMFILLIVSLVSYGSYFALMPAGYIFLIVGIEIFGLLYYIALMFITAAFTEK